VSGTLVYWYYFLDARSTLYHLVKPSLSLLSLSACWTNSIVELHIHAHTHIHAYITYIHTLHICIHAYM
jgi:hypothetical protein